MTVARDLHTDNIVLGAGEIYVDILGAGDALQGERYLGDSVGGTVSVTSERTTIQSGDGAVAQDLVDIVRSVSRTVGFTLHDISIENWRLFLIGTEDSRQIAASAVTDEQYSNLKKGLWYQVGAGGESPGGVGPLKKSAKTDFTGKTGSSGSTAAVIAWSTKLNTSGVREYFDFDGTSKLASPTLLIDVDAGRFQWLVADAAEGARLTYTPAEARTVKQAKATSEPEQLTCALRYIEDGTGARRNVYVRKCNLVPSGEMALKARDTEQQMAFTAAVQAPPAGWPSITIDDLPLSPES